MRARLQGQEGSILTPMHLDPNAVHFYLAGHNAPVVWDLRVQQALTQVAVFTGSSQDEGTTQAARWN